MSEDHPAAGAVQQSRDSLVGELVQIQGVLSQSDRRAPVVGGGVEGEAART